MSDNNNFFFRNRNEKYGVLFFKSWLPKVYFSTMELLRKSSLETAVKLYNHDLNEAIIMCKEQNILNIEKKLEEISQKFLTLSKASNK